LADESGNVTLTHRRIGRNGIVSLTAQFPDGTSYTDQIDVVRTENRKRFIRAVCNRRKGLDRRSVAAELEKIASDLVSTGPPKDDSRAHEGRGPSQADRLVALAADIELFHSPGGHDSEGFATVQINGHRETWPVASKGFRQWLSKRFYDENGKTPGAQAIQDALTVIAGKAIHEGKELAIAVRLAEDESGLWLDLADKEWRAVHVTAAGWEIVSDPPIKFVRRRGMLALPPPVAGGNFNELRELVNLSDDACWILFVAWLCAALRPGRPFPILAVNGEQGSAKSTLCRVARNLIDPNIASLRRPPKDDRDLMIAATNGWIVGYDNLSALKPDLADAICMLATGSGFGTRELFTDGEEKLFEATRPIMVNGIEDLVTRPDLLDRSITLTLSMITDERRQDEDDLWRRFEERRPRILGALLDAVSMALRNRSSVRLASKPRMADFAVWVVSAEPALPWAPGAFLASYNDNRSQGNALALESSILTPLLSQLMDGRDKWEGSLKGLLDELAGLADPKTVGRKDWPSLPRALKGALQRLAPNLRRAGLEVRFGKRTRAGIPVTLERIASASSPSTSSAPSATVQESQPSDAGDEDDDGADETPLRSKGSETGEEVCEWSR
jgi:hypothetical protein